MTDRDHFAAAALTGLCEYFRGSLRPGSAWKSTAVIAAETYEMADAMLRERERREPVAYRDGIPIYSTNHDAAPAARATTKPGGLNSGSASGTSGEQSPVTTRDCGTGDTPATEKEKLAEVSDRTDPVPYAKTYENLGFAPKKRDTTPTRNGTPQDGSLQGEGSVSDSRTANEPVAWAVRYKHGDTGIVELLRTLEECRHRWANRTTDYWQYEPLYRHPQPTLTDAEREAVKRAVNFSEGAAGYCKDQANVKAAMDHAAALRGLLERLGGVR